MERLEHGEQSFDVAPDQRMIARIELRRAHAGGEAPEQLVVLADARLQVGHSIQLSSYEAFSYQSPVTSYQCLPPKGGSYVHRLKPEAPSNPVAVPNPQSRLPRPRIPNRQPESRVPILGRSVS